MTFFPSTAHETWKFETSGNCLSINFNFNSVEMMDINENLTIYDNDGPIFKESVFHKDSIEILTNLAGELNKTDIAMNEFLTVLSIVAHFNEDEKKRLEMVKIIFDTLVPSIEVNDEYKMSFKHIDKTPLITADYNVLKIETDFLKIEATTPDCILKALSPIYLPKTPNFEIGGLVL